MHLLYILNILYNKVICRGYLFGLKFFRIANLGGLISSS